jgi:hypothetical protein
MEARRFLNSSLACEAYQETRKGPPHNDSGGAGTGTIGTGQYSECIRGDGERKRSTDVPPEKPEKPLWPPRHMGLVGWAPHPKRPSDAFLGLPGPRFPLRTQDSPQNLNPRLARNRELGRHWRATAADSGPGWRKKTGRPPYPGRPRSVPMAEPRRNQDAS